MVRFQVSGASTGGHGNCRRCRRHEPLLTKRIVARLPCLVEIRCARHKAGLGEAPGHCFRGLVVTRTRWQIELTFKRFKSLAQLGCLPKYDDDSAKAWLYGELLAALLVEQLIHHASAISPWGYEVGPGSPTQRLA